MAPENRPASLLLAPVTRAPSISGGGDPRRSALSSARVANTARQRWDGAAQFSDLPAPSRQTSSSLASLGGRVHVLGDRRRYPQVLSPWQADRSRLSASRCSWEWGLAFGRVLLYFLLLLRFAPGQNLPQRKPQSWVATSR